MDIYYCTQGREGSNDRWEYEDGWSEGKREEKLKKKFPNPQKAVVKAEFAKRRGQPETDEVVKDIIEKTICVEVRVSLKKMGTVGRKMKVAFS